MKKRYIIIPVVVAAVIGIGACVVYQVNAGLAAMNAMNGVSTELAERQDLKNYITASGTIESSDINKVYSDLVYPVETVNAKVGDVVKEGDILCTIDTELLRQKIDEQEAAINTSDQNTGYNITDAEKAYNDALRDFENNDNTQIISAKNALDNAETALTAAKKAYDDAVKTKGTTDDSSYESAKLSVENAKSSLETAETSLENAKENLDTAKENLEKALKNQKEEDYYSIKQVTDAYDDAKEVRDKARSDESGKEIKEAEDEYDTALALYLNYQSNPDKIPVGSSISDYAQAMQAAKQKIATLKELYDVKTAEENLETAKKAYDKAKKQVDDANENAIDQAENAVTQAENAVTQAEKGIDSANRQIESAELQLRATTKGNSDQIEQLETQLENAETAFNKAKNSYDLTVETVRNSLETLKTQAQRARDRSDNTSAQVALENLYDQLEEATITSPCDGVVTYENVAEGIAPTGVLFVIEDPDDLIINVAISEYDIPDVSTDLKCEIVPNAMTSLSYDGIIESIAPAAAKAATGDDAGTGSFKATVAVTSTDTKLLIGMTARVNIILEEAKDVLSVSSDIIAHDDGGDYVFTAVKVESPATAQTGGLVSVYNAKKVYVKTGLETSFYIEITPVTAGEIEAGTILLTRPQGITDGQVVSVMDQEILAQAMGAAGGVAVIPSGAGGPGGGTPPPGM
ncbi:MAG: HlyD family efflux transporter periplasmic adaptor subunit [Ruminococcus sp.]|jgi:multidrug efflux pump subunit AcrA (membrane-fusion protein)|nr:HlyD family efflux transporter periplasmic adaptor subunit [Ruminococcus sp.]